MGYIPLAPRPNHQTWSLASASDLQCIIFPIQYIVHFIWKFWACKYVHNFPWVSIPNFIVVQHPRCGIPILLFTIECNIEAFPFNIANTGAVDDMVEVLVISEWWLPPQFKDCHSPEIKYCINFLAGISRCLKRRSASSNSTWLWYGIQLSDAFCACGRGKASSGKNCPCSSHFRAATRH